MLTEQKDILPTSQNKEKAYLIPNFLPASKVIYDDSKVEIMDICIKTLNGDIVNALIHGEKYFYCYTLKFHAECQEIAFGMSIKTEKGFQITTTGSKHYDTVINQTSIGDTYTIQWEFICLLTAGVYYANAGTTHQVKNKRQILNRVIDSLAFKVLPLSTKIHGVVSLQQSPSYHLIHKE
ncbi:ABC transporter [hydrothermal vent metagenome]|uniref:ABC transporter n=1 Tax=hydrothermal vent metagenome TaxID=652676 RepID=A0A1W1ED16_9ZZZZ